MTKTRRSNNGKTAANRPGHERSPLPNPARHGVRFRFHFCAFRSRLECRRVATLGDGQNERLFTPLFVEVLVQLQTELANVHSNRAVLERTVTRRLVEENIADMLLR